MEFVGAHKLSNQMAMSNSINYLTFAILSLFLSHASDDSHSLFSLHSFVDTKAKVMSEREKLCTLSLISQSRPFINTTKKKGEHVFKVKKE